MTELKQKPKVNSAGAQELEKAAEQFDKFDAEVKAMTQDRMNQSSKTETEPQVKISTREAQAAKQQYLKPIKVIACGPKDKFNEAFRAQYEFAKEYVPFIAEHNEQTDLIEIWTRPFGGMPAEFWNVPTNKPVWGPRYLAEQIRSCSYHRLKMQNTQTETNGNGVMYGQLAVDSTVQRLDARPVSQNKSVFMGAGGF